MFAIIKEFTYICCVSHNLFIIITMGKFVITVRKNGEFQFNLKASNGQVIGASQMYASEETLKKGIASVAKNAPEAPVVEEI